MDRTIVIHTDGGSRGNPGIGGWGVFIQFSDGKKETYKGSSMETTNNRMELTAAIEALRVVPYDSDVTLYTDSQYVKNGITTWIHGWKTRGWKTANKQPVKNQDLWQALDAETARHTVRWCWVRGHDGDIGNECADELCNLAMDEIN